MLWESKTRMVTCRLDDADWKEFKNLVDNSRGYSNGYSAHIRLALLEYMDKLRAEHTPPPPAAPGPGRSPAKRNTKPRAPKKKSTPAKKSSSSERSRK